ncbi:hypothetical protein KAFR_0J00420 [Kazachstania africana CBS 2517]|uniref:Uncharacterized protein n=1 Tax=Kazachstania africana (strain ATCC 22294 / BCRC 22015 / CBS 2517 / CECT 1963 / NBRC 1671 / NRRL Y-8276) TaxID=1071382 RepID=H2B0G0_KAZAF|nr:hypothetical protein KAFR_0J00420 [Kazachstania africana CBS 2517]CCF60110.1 hypothetical protein KAFR_0J00420 [Kazachstania africana CBS 2517]
MSEVTLEVDLCLFDLDGTIVSTTEAAECAWKELCKKHGVDPVELFKHSHGVRTTEVLKMFFPNIDNANNQAVIDLETSIGRDYLNSVTLIPGAQSLLLSLDTNPENPNERLSHRKWGIVTSGTQELAFSWFTSILKQVGKPEVFITASDVSNGKPDPEGYSAARDKLCDIWNFKDSFKSKTVVFEDAPAGIRAGKAMGARTIGITSSYRKQTLIDAGADYIVEDLTKVTVVKNSEHGNIVLRIENQL